MNLYFQFKRAAQNLQRAKLRTILALAGILVGTASVVALLSVGSLATEMALQQFKSLGVNLMSISISADTKSSQSKPRPITLSMIRPLSSEIPEIRTLAPYASSGADIGYESNHWFSSIIAATEDLAEIIRIKMAEGRFINELDKTQPFCILGKEVVHKMKVISPMGKRIRIRNRLFTVIGVADNWPENGFFPYNINDQIIIPLEILPSLEKNSSINSIVLELKEGANIEKVKQEIATFFKRHLRPYSEQIQSAKEIVNSIEVQQRIFTILLGIIGGISLLVGGIGVVNIMLASVTERKNEIGLRLAIGAQPRDIQLMFLMEASLLGIFGGLGGVVIGILSTWLIALVAGWPFDVFLFPPLIGFSVSLLVTLIFGFYPAYVASKINPIEALRSV